MRRQTETHQHPRVVDFFICGTQKGGTTALYSYLRDHPEVCMSDQKEVHFFDREDGTFATHQTYSDFHSWFSIKASHKTVGEATPIYMYWYNSPRRIWEYNSDAKLIIILRNPIERAFSHWNMECKRNNDTLPFWDAIKKERERCRETLPFQHRIYSYIDRGFYLEQLRRIWFFFPKEQTLILKNENLRNSPKLTLNTVCDFLEIPHFKNIRQKLVHNTPYTTSMNKKERNYLIKKYYCEIKSLEKELGWDCSDWLNGNTRQ